MKKIFSFFMALCVVAPVFAQAEDGEEPLIQLKEKKNTFTIGPSVGLTRTSMTQPNEGKLYDGAGISYSAGLAMGMRFGKASENSPAGTGYVGAGLELKYKQNSVKTLAVDEKGKDNATFALNYFDVPVYLRVYPFTKVRSMNTLHVELGAAIGGTLGRSPKTLTVSNPSENYSSVTYNIDTENSKLKGMDVRPLVGLGYTLPGKGLGLNARYYIGMTELAGNFPCKMSSFELSLSWMFNAGKF